MLLVLALLPSFAVAQLISTDAKCLSGFEWMFSSVNQSPCDVAAELAGVCVGGQFNLQPLGPGFVYLGPAVANANSCRCSSVYYNLLSGCAYCQGRTYVKWSGYNTNCSTIYSQVFIQPIPAGVKVPAWAYQSLDNSDNFNVTLAQATKGVESSRAAAASGTGSGVAATGTSSRGSSSVNIPAIVGGVVGGLVLLGLIGGLIAFLIVQKKKKQKEQPSKFYPSGTQLQNMPHTPMLTGGSAALTTGTPVPNSPGRVYDPNDPATYPVLDGHNTGTDSFNAEPQRQQSPFSPQGVVPNVTGNSLQPFTPQSPNAMPHSPPMRYTGAPEL